MFRSTEISKTCIYNYWTFNKIQVIFLNWIRPTTHGPRNDLNFEREQYVWIIDGDFSISNSSVLEKYLFWWTHQGGIQTDGY